MPNLDAALATGTAQLNRIFAYGPSQSRKTWWAGTIAEAGYNVLLLDGDGNPGVLRNLSEAARKRIYMVNIQDTAERAVASLFWAMLLKKHFVWYNETTHECYLAEVGGCTLIDIRGWNNNFVIVGDSYTSLAESVAFQYSIEQKIDLAEASKPDWDGYGWCGRLLSWMLESMKKLPCHLIMIGHSTQYEKKKNIVEPNGRTRQETEWSRRQPKSCSGPHGMQVGRCFGECYYMYQQGNSAKIEPFGDQWADGGSRFLDRKILLWEQFPAWKAFQDAGTAPAAADLPYIQFSVSEKATLAEVAAAKREAKANLAAGLGAPTPVQPGINLS